MERDDAYLLDIVESARLAVSYVVGKTKEEFRTATLLQDATIRRLGVIGEAARRTSEAKRNELPHLPWRAMIGMRNIVIHEYDTIDWQSVWDTLQKDLPILIATLEHSVPPEK